MQGIGAALLVPGTLAIISRAFPERGEQARAIGIWPASAASRYRPVHCSAACWCKPGVAVGVLLNVPIVLIAGVVAARIVRPEDDRGTGRLDRAGTVLGALVLATATFAVIQAGQAGLDVPVIAAIVVAVLSLVGYLRVERTVADPMLPLGLFRRPAFSTANGVAGVMNLGTLGLLFLLTLFLKDLQHRSALGAGVAVLPLFLPLAVLAPLAGRVTARIGPKPPMLAGLLLAGVGLLATWTPSTPYLQLLPGMLCWGIGLGILTPAVVAAAIAAAPPERSGLASGVNNTARQAGGAITAYGATAGQPGKAGHFLTGLHVAGLVTTGLFVLAAAGTAVLIPTHTDQEAHR